MPGQSSRTLASPVSHHLRRANGEGVSTPSGVDAEKRTIVFTITTIGSSAQVQSSETNDPSTVVEVVTIIFQEASELVAKVAVVLFWRLSVPLCSRCKNVSLDEPASWRKLQYALRVLEGLLPNDLHRRSLNSGAACVKPQACT